MSTLTYQVSNLVKTYKSKRKNPVHANKGINLEIPQGIIFGIFGPNGAGKTTLINQLVGLVRPTEGQIYLFGHDVVQHSVLIPRFVGYCGQRLQHLWRLNAFEVLTLTGRLRGMPKAAAIAQAEELLTLVNFQDKKHRLLRDCSGGEMRIISVFAALMGKMPVIVLDEPTTGLDPIVRKQLWDILVQYKEENNATIILVTHNVLEAEKVVDYIAIVDAGKIIAQGKPADLKKEYDEEVSIELKCKPDFGFIIDLPGWSMVREHVYCYKGKMVETEAVLGRVGKTIGVAVIEDIKVTPFSLEDYYVKKVGKAWK